MAKMTDIEIAEKLRRLSRSSLRAKSKSMGRCMVMVPVGGDGVWEDLVELADKIDPPKRYRIIKDPAKLMLAVVSTPGAKLGGKKVYNGGSGWVFNVGAMLYMAGEEVERIQEDSVYQFETKGGVRFLTEWVEEIPQAGNV